MNELIIWGTVIGAVLVVFGVGASIVFRRRPDDHRSLEERFQLLAIFVAILVILAAAPLMLIGLLVASPTQQGPGYDASVLGGKVIVASAALGGLLAVIGLVWRRARLILVGCAGVFGLLAVVVMMVPNYST